MPKVQTNKIYPNTERIRVNELLYTHNSSSSSVWVSLLWIWKISSVFYYSVMFLLARDDDNIVLVVCIVLFCFIYRTNDNFSLFSFFIFRWILSNFILCCIKYLLSCSLEWVDDEWDVAYSMNPSGRKQQTAHTHVLNLKKMGCVVIRGSDKTRLATVRKCQQSYALSSFTKFSIVVPKTHSALAARPVMPWRKTRISAHIDRWGIFPHCIGISGGEWREQDHCFVPFSSRVCVLSLLSFPHPCAAVLLSTVTPSCVYVCVYHLYVSSSSLTLYVLHLPWRIFRLFSGVSLTRAPRMCSERKRAVRIKLARTLPAVLHHFHNIQEHTRMNIEQAHNEQQQKKKKHFHAFFAFYALKSLAGWWYAWMRVEELTAGGCLLFALLCAYAVLLMRYGPNICQWMCYGVHELDIAAMCASRMYSIYATRYWIWLLYSTIHIQSQYYWDPRKIKEKRVWRSSIASTSSHEDIFDVDSVGLDGLRAWD